MEIMRDVWNAIINSSMKELYVEFVLNFMSVCDISKFVEIC